MTIITEKGGPAFLQIIKYKSLILHIKQGRSLDVRSHCNDNGEAFP
jgi:hypothetical protein